MRGIWSNEEEFDKLLYMPEALIIYRFHFKKNGTTNAWWKAFSSLPPEKLSVLKNIVHDNKFADIEALTTDKKILKVLKFYTISREDAEKVLLETPQ